MNAENGSAKSDGAFTINGNIEFTMNGGTSNSKIYATHGANGSSGGATDRIRPSDYIVNGSSTLTFNNADINAAVYGSAEFNLSTNSNTVTGAISITGNTTTFDAAIYGNQGASVDGGVNVTIKHGSAKDIYGFAGGGTVYNTIKTDADNKTIYRYVYDENYDPVFNADGTFKIVNDVFLAVKNTSSFSTFVYSDIVVS